VWRRLARRLAAAVALLCSLSLCACSGCVSGWLATCAVALVVRGAGHTARAPPLARFASRRVASRVCAATLLLPFGPETFPPGRRPRTFSHQQATPTAPRASLASLPVFLALAAAHTALSLSLFFFFAIIHTALQRSFSFRFDSCLALCLLSLPLPFALLAYLLRRFNALLILSPPDEMLANYVTANIHFFPSIISPTSI
jgi:hypothetical protein